MRDRGLRSLTSSRLLKRFAGAFVVDLSRSCFFRSAIARRRFLGRAFSSSGGCRAAFGCTGAGMVEALIGGIPDRIATVSGPVVARFRRRFVSNDSGEILEG